MCYIYEGETYSTKEEVDTAIIKHLSKELNNQDVSIAAIEYIWETEVIKE